MNSCVVKDGISWPPVKFINLLLLVDVLTRLYEFADVTVKIPKVTARILSSESSQLQLHNSTTLVLV